MHLKTPISNDDGQIVNIAPTIRVWFAIVPELNESVILTPNVVTLLNDIARYDVILPNLKNSELDCVGLIQKEMATAGSEDNVDSADNSHANKDCGGSQILVVNKAESNTIKPLDNNETEYFDTEQTQTVQNERVADRATLSAEQKRCPSLQHSWNLGYSNKGNFYIDDGLLYHRETIFGHKVNQLCLPECRIPIVLRMGHDAPFAGHMAFKATRHRVRLSFWFQNMNKRIKQYCATCVTCQLRAPVKVSDRVPITPIAHP